MVYYDTCVPANTSATLYLPAVGEVEAPESVKVIGTVVHNGLETTQIELPSGCWHFSMEGESIQIEAVASADFPVIGGYSAA